MTPPNWVVGLLLVDEVVEADGCMETFGRGFYLVDRKV